MNEDFEYEFVAPKQEQAPAVGDQPQDHMSKEFQYEFTPNQPEAAPSDQGLKYDFNAPPAQPAISEDIARTAAAKTPQALLGTALGGIGSAESFLAQDLPHLAKIGAAKIGEKMDWLSPAEAEAFAAAPKYSDQIGRAHV